MFSEPLLINRWSWFFAPQQVFDPASLSFKSTAKVATIHGSNTNKWLIEHNYIVATKANSAFTFPILLLEKKRIDAVFLASAVFREELIIHGYTAEDYMEVEQKATPFGIYIAKSYLEKHPAFMGKLNLAIIKFQDLN